MFLFPHGSGGGQHNGQDGDYHQQFRNRDKPLIILVGVVPDSMLIHEHRHILKIFFGNPHAFEGCIETVLTDDLRTVAGGKRAQHGVAAINQDLHIRMFTVEQGLLKICRDIQHDQRLPLIQQQDALPGIENLATELEIGWPEAVNQLARGLAVVCIMHDNGGMIQLQADVAGHDNINGEQKEDCEHQKTVAPQLQQFLDSHGRQP